MERSLRVKMKQWEKWCAIIVERVGIEIYNFKITHIIIIHIPQVELEISVEESGDILKEKEVVLQVLTYASGAQDIEKEVTLSIIEDVELVLNGLVDTLNFSKHAQPHNTTFTMICKLLLY